MAQASSHSAFQGQQRAVGRALNWQTTLTTPLITLRNTKATALTPYTSPGREHLRPRRQGREATTQPTPTPLPPSILFRHTPDRATTENRTELCPIATHLHYPKYAPYTRETERFGSHHGQLPGRRALSYCVSRRRLLSALAMYTDCCKAS